MIFFILIALFFICIFARFYRWTAAPSIKWPAKLQLDNPSECLTDSDCPLVTQKCFQQTSCKVAAVTDDCQNGTWVLDPDDNSRVKCKCNYPDLLNQYLDGASCTVDTACGVFGHLRDLTDPTSCECNDPQMVFVNGQCVEKRAQQKPKQKCTFGEILSSSPEAKKIFDPLYLAQFKEEYCLKTPCTFNVINGRRLRHVNMISENGNNYCVCHPMYGNYGVALDVQHYLLNDGGRHNACASIYENEPLFPNRTNFKLFCYFYIPNHPPVCFVVFDFLKGSDGLAFPGKRVVSIEDQWPNTYDQYILSKWPVYMQRQHYAETFIFNIDYVCNTLKPKKTYAPYCEDMPNDPYRKIKGAFLNNIYKDHFVCKLKKTTNDMYKDKVIVNPYCIEVKEDGERYSHGYQMYMTMQGEWSLKPAPSPFPDYFQFGNHAVELMGKPFTFKPKQSYYQVW